MAARGACTGGAPTPHWPATPPLVPVRCARVCVGGGVEWGGGGTGKGPMPHMHRLVGPPARARAPHPNCSSSRVRGDAPCTNEMKRNASIRLRNPPPTEISDNGCAAEYDRNDLL